MRRWAIGLSVWIGAVGAAVASDTGPTIVIPGRAGVPVIINGSDASFGVVEGDWGLGKGVHVQPVVYGGWDNYVGKSPGDEFVLGYAALSERKILEGVRRLAAALAMGQDG